MDLYDLDRVTFSVTGPEASMLFDLLGAELKKSNQLGRETLRRLERKLSDGAADAIDGARAADPKVRK